MTEKRQVNIKDFVNDLRSEMADQELMSKYHLSAKGLHRAFQKLIELGSITQDEIDGRTQSVQDTIFFQSMRELPRHYLVIPIPIHEVSGTSHGTGKIRDITQKGLGIIGIKASVGEEKIFSIRSNEFVAVPPFFVQSSLQVDNKNRFR